MPGHHPFGALLMGPDHETVLCEQGNIDTVNHAEAVLARTAAKPTPPTNSGAARCTPPSSPAACAPARSTGRTSAASSTAEREALLGLTGDHPENPTLDLPCREVFARGRKPVEVLNPVPEVRTGSRRRT